MAIDFSVAHPLLRDADLVWARKLLVRVALGRGTIQFVREVSAVVVGVAHPSFLDALSVAARELVRATSLIWTSWKRERNGQLINRTTYRRDNLTDNSKWVSQKCHSLSLYVTRLQLSFVSVSCVLVGVHRDPLICNVCQFVNVSPFSLSCVEQINRFLRSNALQLRSAPLSGH